jgi:hypothetical protein
MIVVRAVSDRRGWILGGLGPGAIASEGVQNAAVTRGRQAAASGGTGEVVRGPGLVSS